MNIIEPLLKLYQSSPEHILICEGAKQYSVQEAVSLACSIAKRLASYNLPKGSHIGIALPRGAYGVLSIYGILLSGNIYVPLDIKAPQERLKFIAADAKLKAVIGLDKPSWTSEDTPWIEVDKLQTDDCMHTKNFPLDRNDSDGAAILYTSGTSGPPKGILLSHQAIGYFVNWAAEKFLTYPAPKLASIAPMFFDLSLFDFFAPLQINGSIYFVGEQLVMSPVAFTQWLKENSITTIYTVPSFLALWGKRGNVDKTELPKLKTILFAGEVFPISDLKHLVNCLPKTDFFNLFGPTETNVCCYWHVDREKVADMKNIPIGKCVEHYEYEISPETKELRIKGPGLFSGYWRNGALDTTPIRDGRYNTGDVISLQDGEFIYHGRADRMLKIFGHRVEPGEIESLANSFIGINESYATVIKKEGFSDELFLCVVAEENLDDRALLLFLRENLPHYMIPHKIRHFESIPRLANGKLDCITIEKKLKEHHA